jgi:hypothetical protein
MRGSYRNIVSHVPPTKVREIATMLKAIHASEDIVAAREKAVRVIDKLRTLRLTKAAELAEGAVEETRSHPDLIIDSSGSCVRSDGARVWSVLFRTGNRLSILRPPG